VLCSEAKNVIDDSNYLFISVDYDTLELRALAQAMKDLLGVEGELLNALRAGKDLHLDGAADILGILYEEAEKRKREAQVKELRQLFKIANFGFPGGMSAKTFVEYAKGYGVKIAPEKSAWLKRQWERKWPEIPNQYFPFVAETLEKNNGVITQVRSGRKRGRVSFTAAANGYFQGLAADGAKEACWAVTKACYVQKDSPLYGSRPVAFIHDEIIVEARRDRAHWAAEEMCRLMVEAMQKWLPDVPVKVSPSLMYRWWKEAEEVRDANGMLIPWEPKS
jgi:DNA polymerase I-like protein with 3'-5' exonuclease and polymerase domains